MTARYELDVELEIYVFKKNSDFTIRVGGISYVHCSEKICYALGLFIAPFTFCQNRCGLYPNCKSIQTLIKEMKETEALK